MSLLKIALLPCSFLYGMAVEIRNIMFDIGILKSKRFEIPILCVGNITVGGTGKTPHTELIIDTLRKRFRVACLSRGYKRKSSGFILASETSTAEQIGDEPLQIKMKFPDIMVACDSNRVRGIEKLLALPEPPDVIVLDDAFQHRYVQPDKSIVLIDYNRPVTEDSLLPLGRLREHVGALKRADYIIITKCPHNLNPIDLRIFYKRLNIRPYQHLYFTTIGYGDILPLFPEQRRIQLTQNSSILCVTGIAQPGPYYEYLESLASQVVRLPFPDHHAFSNRDIQKIAASFDAIENEEKYIFTTEKDASRLRFCELPDNIRQNIYYVPIVPDFIKDKELFVNEVFEYVRKNKK